MSAQTHTVTGSLDRPSAQPLLRRALQADSLVVLVSGVAFAVGAGPLSQRTGLPNLVVLELGIALLAYGAFLWWAINSLPLRQVGWFNVAIGVLWVVGSIVLLVGGWLPLTSFGWWFVVVVAIAVDLITSLQAYALIRRK